MFSLNKNKKNGRNQPLLVLVSDGFNLLATIVEDQNQEVRFLASARSNSVDPHTALMEVVGRLAVSYGKLPNDAIMLHSHAIPSILELPIDNVKNLEKSKIQELVRWEMESVFGDLVPHDNLGWLMISLGFISEEQRDKIVRTLEVENTNSGKKSRIGEMAMQSGFINRNQLEQCLKVQDQLQLQDQRVKCAWHGLGEAQPSHWMATAVSNAIHEQWVEAFDLLKSKVSFGKTRLKAFYPFIGTSAVQIADIYAGNQVYILEMHRPYLVLLHYESGSIRQCLTLECSSDTPGLNDVETLLQSADLLDDAEINVFVTHSDRNNLRESLDEIKRFNFIWLERELPLTKAIPGDISTSEAVMISGSALAYTSNNHDFLVPVEGQAPPPPFYKTEKFKIVSAIGAILLVVVAIETALTFKAKKLNTELANVNEKVRLQTEVKQDMRASKQEQQKLDLMNVQYQTIQATKKLIESVLITRQDFTNAFLKILTRNLNDNLLINSINEESWNKFVIQGWAADQPSIDYFGRGLSRDLKEWNMEITENPSNLGRNANGYAGYKFKFVIQKVSPANLRARTNSNKS